MNPSEVGPFLSRMGAVIDEMGAGLGWGVEGPQPLPGAIGMFLAKDVNFSAHALDGQEAKVVGLISHILEQNEDGDATSPTRGLGPGRKVFTSGPVPVAMEEACYLKLLQQKTSLKVFLLVKRKGLLALKENRRNASLQGQRNKCASGSIFQIHVCLSP